MGPEPDGSGGGTQRYLPRGFGACPELPAGGIEVWAACLLLGTSCCLLRGFAPGLRMPCQLLGQRGDPCRVLIASQQVTHLQWSRTMEFSSFLFPASSVQGSLNKVFLPVPIPPFSVSLSPPAAQPLHVQPAWSPGSGRNRHARAGWSATIMDTRF